MNLVLAESNAGSDPLTETDLAGNNPAEYIFFGGKRIARRHIVSGQPDAISYYFADHLGTSRVVTSATGTVLDDSDFYPFGGERPYLSSSGNNYKFTGKERDVESGLDDFGARYDSSAMGRFMSPDPLMASAHVGDPQSWNRYTYGRVAKRSLGVRTWVPHPLVFKGADFFLFFLRYSAQQGRSNQSFLGGVAQAWTGM